MKFWILSSPWLYLRNPKRFRIWRKIYEMVGCLGAFFGSFGINRCFFVTDTLGCQECQIALLKTTKKSWHLNTVGHSAWQAYCGARALSSYHKFHCAARSSLTWDLAKVTFIRKVTVLNIEIQIIIQNRTRILINANDLFSFVSIDAWNFKKYIYTEPRQLQWNFHCYHIIFQIGHNVFNKTSLVVKNNKDKFAPSMEIKFKLPNIYLHA